MALDFRLLFPEEFISGLLNEGLREDGRQPDQARTVTINRGSISTAYGSAVVRVGGTCVICGITAELSNPSDEYPDQGYLICNVDMTSLPPNKGGKLGRVLGSLGLSQLVYDTVVESRCIDLSSLCLVKEKLCWVVTMTIQCISCDGVLVDAIMLAAMAALQNVKLPQVTAEDATPVVTPSQSLPLTIPNTVVATSIAVHNSWPLLVDPTLDELALCSGIIVVAISGCGSIAGLHKLGGPAVDDSRLQQCIDIAKKQCNIFHKLINKI